jgi:hypothetical protein
VNIFKGLALGLAVLGAVLLTTPIQAQTFPVSVTCAHSGETCTPTFSTPITVGVVGPIQLSFAFAPTACSDVEVIMSVDSTPVFTTAFLTPGQNAMFTTGSISAGAHTVALQGIGEVGGCNTGNLVSWAGTLTVSSASPSSSATPLPATWMLLTFGLMCLGTYQAKDRIAQLFRQA